MPTFLTKKTTFFLSLVLILFSQLSFASLSISPSPVSGSINLDSQSATIYFSNPTLSVIPMSLALSGTGFSLGIDRCSGKNLSPKTSCYIVINVKDSLLSAGVNSASLNNNSSLLVSFNRTKIQNSNPSIFTVTSLSIDDFLSKEIIIKNQTSITRSYSPFFSGGDSSKYEIVSNRCLNIASGKSCVVTIRLKPQQSGSYWTSITEPQILINSSITSSISGSTVGVVSPPVSSVSVSPLLLNFGELTKFRPSQGQTVTITNNGNTALTPIINLSSKITMLINRCNVQLAVGKSCAISVAMSPVYQTDFNGALTGSVSIQASLSSPVQTVSATSTLNVPPASIAYNSEGGTCPPGQLFENNVCVSNGLAGNLSCQHLKDSNPSAVSGYYDLNTSSGLVNVYCDMTDASNAYIEIFNIEREPMLSDAQIIERIGKFSNSGLLASQIVRDSNGSVAWTQDNTNFGLISGQSLGFDKLHASKIKLSVNLGSGGVMGQMVLHNVDKTGCSAETSDMLGCYQTAYKYQDQLRLIFGDFGTGIPAFTLVNTGVSSAVGFPYVLDNYIVDNVSQLIYLTQAGRLEGGTNYPSPFFFFKKLLIKGEFFDSTTIPQLSCADTKSIGGHETSGYYMLDSDGLSGPLVSTAVYCDMSGAGVATITENCNKARIFGQKNSLNNSDTGMYQIDYDGSGSDSPANQYCDMTPTIWNNNEGGYTLAGIFNTNSVIEATSHITDISNINKYLTDVNYQKLLQKSSEILLRSNRGNNTEVVFRLFKVSQPGLNCNSNTYSAVPTNLNLVTSAVYITPQGAFWYWGESGCNFSGGDYSMVGIRSDVGHVYQMFSLQNNYLSYFDWNTNLFTTVPGGYVTFPRDSNEPIHIFLK